MKMSSAAGVLKNHYNKAYRMKKAIVVGATSGIGKALCKTLIANHYLLGITGPEQDLLEEIKNSAPDKIHALCFDSVKESNATHLNKLAKTLGKIDLLVFCSGIGNQDENDGFEKENQANQLNVIAFTEIAHWAYHYFEAQGYGHFASISSLAGLFGYRKAPAYHAAKSYQIIYLESLRQRAHRSKKNIYITDIRPSFVNTDMADDNQKFWSISRERAASEIYKLIKKKRAVGYLSKRWCFIAFLVKAMPRIIRKRM